MYYQVYCQQSLIAKKSQFSCDSFQEVQELLEAKRPKLVTIEYFDCTGHVGTAVRMYNTMKEFYVLVRKWKALEK